MALIDSDFVITIKSYKNGEITEIKMPILEFIKRYTSEGAVPLIEFRNDYSEKQWMLRSEIRYDHRWECPYCGAISYDITPYCCSCGKKIALGSEQK